MCKRASVYTRLASALQNAFGRFYIGALGTHIKNIRTSTCKNSASKQLISFDRFAFLGAFRVQLFYCAKHLLFGVTKHT